MTTGFASTPKSAETLIRLPRYTSYPTAMSFTGAVGPEQFAAWASAVPAETVMSAYIHVPFCHSLCWFCGCQTSITSRYRPVAAYVETLLREIDLVAGLLPGRRTIERLHWGGGTPTMIAPDDLMAIDERLRQRFDLAEDGEISIELDPRSVGDDHLRALAATGVTRASLGVQDFDLEVQKSVNRVQPPQLTARLTAKLRGIGIANVNIDLMYGLPRQTEAGVARTADLVAALRPDRIALFGYAHVPWAKRHQRLIDAASLPGPEERRAQFAAAQERLSRAGYVPVGLDHFVLPEDSLARARRANRLHRSFQGYTDDSAPVLLGFGASAISRFPQGYAQNAPAAPGWRKRIESGVPATMRGVVPTWGDRIRAEIIERLMCDFGVDLESVSRRYDVAPTIFESALRNLQSMVGEGLVTIDGSRVLADPGEDRAQIRRVAAAFDEYLPSQEAERFSTL